MMSKDINEPIILSFKLDGIRFYLSLLSPLLLIGFGLYWFFEGGPVLVILFGVALFLVKLSGRFRNETFITEDAIYLRGTFKKYKTFRFTDLSYSIFTDDTVYFIFGEDGSEEYSISNDANDFEEIRKHLEKVSQKHLPYHKYEFALRAELSSFDKLGCLECFSIFGYSSVTQWAKEKTLLSFLRKQKPQIPLCPSCNTEGRVIVSRTGKVTTLGLKSLNELRKKTNNTFNS